jgi:hypothetical protein
MYRVFQFSFLKFKLSLVCFWCSLKYTHDMDLNFGYVALYGLSRSVAKVCMILTCIFSVMIYVSFMLD